MARSLRRDLSTSSAYLSAFDCISTCDLYSLASALGGGVQVQGIVLCMLRVRALVDVFGLRMVYVWCLCERPKSLYS